MSIRRALWILIVTTALARLIIACFLGLGNDEAYHLLYAAHPVSGLLRPSADDGLDRNAGPDPGR